MNAIELLENLERTSSRKEKETILQQADHVTRSLLLLALDPYRTYGLQDIAAPVQDPEVAAFDRTVTDGLQVTNELLGVDVAQLGMILDALHRRDLVGNEARAIVNQFLKELSPPTAKWFHRVILKDLRCGVTEKTVNKVFPGLVPGFSVALAEDASGTTPKVQFPIWSDYKLDGIRLVAIKEGGNVTLFSRKGHIIDTLPSLTELLSTAHDDFMLDGEVMGSGWNETQSTVFATKNKVDDGSMYYNVFDGMTVGEWRAQQSRQPYRARREFAKGIITQIANTRVRLVGGKLLTSQEGVQEFFKEALRLGHEGIMLKDPEALYSFKRSKAVIKMKPSATWEGSIVGFEQGDPNGKWAGKFGAFQVQVKEGGPVTSVGGGFTDEARETFTAQLAQNPQYYNGQIIEVKGQELTPDGLVRFPVFLRFRNEKDK